MKQILVMLAGVLLLIACGQPDEPATTDTAPEPAAGDDRVASADGLPLAYSVQGDGPVAVVLIHGWMCDSSYWDEQVPFLAESYQVITVDLGGHGRSGMDRVSWPISAFTEDVAAVVNHVDPQMAILVGHSMGGPVALQAAARLAERVIGVVGVDTLHNVEATYDDEQMAPFLSALESDFPTACDAFVRDMFQADADVELVQRVASDMCNGPSDVGISLMHQFVDLDVASLIGGVDVPVRSINADKWPTDVEANRRHNPGFDAAIVEGVGHFLMMERPEAFNPLLATALAEIAHSTL